MVQWRGATTMITTKDTRRATSEVQWRGEAWCNGDDRHEGHTACDERGVERCGRDARVDDIDGVQSGGHKPTTTAFPLEERIKKLNKRRRKKSKKTKKSKMGRPC